MFSFRELYIEMLYFFRAHLAWAWKAVNGEVTRNELRSKTHVHVCCSHLIHQVARNLAGVKLTPAQRQFIFQATAALISCTNYCDFKELLGNLLILIKCQKSSPAVVAVETFIDVSGAVWNNNQILACVEGYKTEMSAREEDIEVSGEKMVPEPDLVGITGEESLVAAAEIDPACVDDYKGLSDSSPFKVDLEPKFLAADDKAAEASETQLPLAQSNPY